MQCEELGYLESWIIATFWYQREQRLIPSWTSGDLIRLITANFLLLHGILFVLKLLICFRAVCNILAATYYRRTTGIRWKLIFLGIFIIRKNDQNFIARPSKYTNLSKAKSEMRRAFALLLFRYLRLCFASFKWENTKQVEKRGRIGSSRSFSFFNLQYCWKWYCMNLSYPCFHSVFRFFILTTTLTIDESRKLVWLQEGATSCR